MTTDKSQELFARNKKGSSFFRQFDWTHLIFCFLMIGLHILLLDTGRLHRFENVFLDYFFRQRPAEAVDDSIVMIEIDEESIDSIGTWPWPLSYHAQMIDILKNWHAKTIVFDFPFRSSEGADEGAKLETAIRSHGNVYLSVSLETKVEKKIWVHSMPIVLEPKSDQLDWVHSLSDVEAQAKGLGHHYVLPDDDGVLRKIETLIDRSGETLPYIGLKVGIDEIHLSDENKQLADYPKKYRKQFMINWTGKYKDSFKRYSYSQIIRSYQASQRGMDPIVNPEDFKGKICFVGFGAGSLNKGITTPIESGVPQMSAHAYTLSNLIHSRKIQPVGFRSNAFFLVAIGIVASFLFTNFRNLQSFVGGLAIGAIWLLTSYLLFWKSGQWVFVFHPIFLVLTLFVFSALYHQIVSGREQSRLFDLATRDGLTGLYVIRHFREILNRVVLEVKNSDEPLSLILIDIDNFKPINDTYGHPAGDMVLRKTAQVIMSQIRSKRAVHEADFAARYGGEEFIILLRKTDLEKASKIVAERIRVAIEETKYVWNSHPIKVTASFGVATLHSKESVPDAMVHRADAALYRSKKTGKNKVSIELESDK